VAVPPQLATLIESLLFASGDPLTLQDILKVLREFKSSLDARTVRKAIEALRVDLREKGRGIRVAEVAGGFQLRTPSEASPYLKKLVSRRPPRMTRATLETLAIVAYRQPVTRGEVEEIRGVDCGAVLKHLLEKKLVRILGRKEEPGRPLLYGTTREFLAFFSLKDLGSLPTLRDFTELTDEHRAALGLGPAGPETEDESLQAEPGAMLPMETDAYTPVGDDEVVQELAEVLSEVKKRDRDLRKTLPKPPAPKPEQGEAEAPADGGPATGEATPPAEAAAPPEPAATDAAPEPAAADAAPAPAPEEPATGPGESEPEESNG
jgi:segregation and condensation protein B